MTRFDLKTMTVSELTDRFIAIAVEQDKAIFDDDNAKFNRLYDQMEDIRNELKSRPGDQRSALLPLFDPSATESGSYSHGHRTWGRSRSVSKNR